MDSRTTTKIPKTDYNLVNQKETEMIEFKSNAQTSTFSEQSAPAQNRRGKCSEEWDCFCFSCDCDCLD